MKTERCEDCHFYKMIDSGYGSCFRFPPKFIVLGLFQCHVRELTPTVEWDRKACGEFRFKKT